jgi:hypothetical protein
MRKSRYFEHKDAKELPSDKSKQENPHDPLRALSKELLNRSGDGGQGESEKSALSESPNSVQASEDMNTKHDKTPGSEKQAKRKNEKNGKRGKKKANQKKVIIKRKPIIAALSEQKPLKMSEERTIRERTGGGIEEKKVSERNMRKRTGDMWQSMSKRKSRQYRGSN